jgi:hypothetical protein
MAKRPRAGPGHALRRRAHGRSDLRLARQPPPSRSLRHHDHGGGTEREGGRVGTSCGLSQSLRPSAHSASRSPPYWAPTRSTVPDSFSHCRVASGPGLRPCGTTKEVKGQPFVRLSSPGLTWVRPHSLAPSNLLGRQGDH